MGFGDVTTKASSKGFGSVSSVSKTTNVSPTTNTTDLTQSQSVPVLTRVSNALQSFEPGGEVANYFKEKKQGYTAGTALKDSAIKYVSEVGRGLGSAVPMLDQYTKPNELQAQHEGFSDALKETGLPEGELKIGDTRLGSVRGLAGTAGDILVDPSNLFLAGLFKNVGKGAIKIGAESIPLLEKTALGTKALSKTTAFKDILSEAFIPSYKEASQLTPEVSDLISQSNKIKTDNQSLNKVIDLYDKIQNIWKGSVTSYFPAFHARNMLGNVFNNFLGGVTNPADYTDAIKVQKGIGELPETFKNLLPEASTFEDLRNGLSKLGITNKGQFAVESTKDLENVLSKAAGKVVNFPRDVGTHIEDNARLAHYISKIKSGLSVTDATKSVNKYLFDYSNLTPFEQNVMKRVFPFYTWSRKNIPLQLQQLYEQPSKYKAVTDVIDNALGGESKPEERQYLPDYIKNKLGVNLSDDKEGNTRIWGNFGLPMEDLEKITDPKTSLNLLSPILKTPIESTSGHSFLYNKPITDISAYNQTTKSIGDIPILKQFLKAVPDKDKAGNDYYKVDPERMYALKTVAGRFMTTGEKATSDNISPLLKALNLLTGTQVFTTNTDKNKQYAIKGILKSLGVTTTNNKSSRKFGTP